MGETAASTWDASQKLDEEVSLEIFLQSQVQDNTGKGAQAPWLSRPFLLHSNQELKLASRSRNKTQ